jgi:hypothetical protein
LEEKIVNLEAFGINIPVIACNRDSIYLWDLLTTIDPWAKEMWHFMQQGV